MSEQTRSEAGPAGRGTLDAARDSMTEIITDRSRAFDMTLDIDASPEEVWRALTEAEELVRWFPLRAQVTPGPDGAPAGGTMAWWWSRDAGPAWEHRIDAWEPLKRLRLLQPPRPDESRPERAGAAPVALEFTLETHAGGTRLRMVHSGFGFGGSWDEEYDGIKGGWQYELRGLRLYLERHRGQTRSYGLALATSSLTPQAAWSRLISSDAFALDAPASGRGAFTVAAATGDRLSGEAFLLVPGVEFAGVVPALHDALLRIMVYGEDGRTGLLVSLSSYTPEDTPAVEAFTARAEALLRRVFPS